jgi:hypothetical protein
MDKYEKRLSERLHESGAQLISTRRHRKWRLSSGKLFVQPSTPSDWRNSRKQLSTLNRLLDSQLPEAITVESMAELAVEAPPPNRRFRVANNPARHEAGVSIPKLPQFPQYEPLPTSERKVGWQFIDLHDVLSAIDNVPEYGNWTAAGGSAYS